MTAPERPATLCDAFQRTAAIDPDAVALRTPDDSESFTWRDYAAQVRRAAAGLAGLGVRRGDTVSLMMANRIEFYPLEVGAQHLGATSFSVYNTLPAEQLTYLFENAGTTVVICEEQYVDRIRASKAPIEHIVCIDGSPAGGSAERILSLHEMYAAADDDSDFESTWLAVQPDDVVTLIYTSGTTGNPKGVEMTHTNLLFEAFAVEAVLGIEFGDRITSFLPSAHIADRMTGLYTQEVFGTQVTVVSDGRNIAAALPDVRPTIWVAVPRIWEKLKAGIELAVVHEADDTRRQALRWGLSGAAPIPRETLAFFAGIGIPIAEVWGMSELSCVASVSHPRDVRLGTAGRLLPGLEGRIVEDGEYLVRGPLVMNGYRREPAKTAEAVDADGWLHTGDILEVDSGGYLRVIDRKKELIINAAGKDMSPANIENTILAAWSMVGAMATIGDGRPDNTALMVFDADSVGPYAEQRRLADATAAALAADAEMIARIAAGVAEGNAKLARVEQIKRFRVLPTLWEPGGDEITLTMKLKRRPIAEKYATEIEELYASEPGPEVHEPEPAQTAQPV